MHIDKTSYSDFLKIENPKYKDILKQLTGTDCLCCSSISCPDNWTVSYTLSKLIYEFKDNIKIKQKIRILYICNLIKDKFKISFLPIEQYI